MDLSRREAGTQASRNDGLSVGTCVPDGTALLRNVRPA